MSRTFYSLLLCCIALTSLSQSTETLNDVTLGPGIEKLKARPHDSAVIILTYRSKEQAKAARETIKAHRIPLVGPEFDNLPIQGVKVTGTDLDWLTRLPGAYGIWANKKLNGELHQAVVVSRVKNVKEDAEFTSLNGGLPITGRGVGVLINDSGFDGDDTDIEASDLPGKPKRIFQNVKGTGVTNWLEDAGSDQIIKDTDQGGGHGSHCMGIVGGDGRKSAGKYTGVAPGAYLIGYGSGAGISILDVAGGFEYTLRHGRDYNIKVMSNSFGTTGDTTFLSFDPSDPTNIATKELADKGVIVVFSAGNSGPTDGKITGNYKTAPWIICVANGQKDGTLASSSSRGRPSPSNNTVALQNTITWGGKSYLWENRPTLTAPGTDIVAVRATAGTTPIVGATLPDEVTGLSLSELPYYSILSGTSMACPHIAGVVALMLEANPNLEWRAVKAILQRTVVPMPANKIWEAGTGYVNAHAAVAAAYFGLMNVPANATYDQKYGLPADGSFGFSTDPWKTGTLHPEVVARMSNSFPSVEGVQSQCTVDTPPLTDPTAESDLADGTATLAPYTDIKKVDFINETTTTFDIKLEVNGGLLAAPAGVSGVSQRYWDVHFTLDKITDEVSQPTPQISYIVSSYKEGLTKMFKLTVRSNDGTSRPNTNALHYEDITGVWNEINNTITWTVPKAKLNVSAAPASTSTAGSRDSRTARKGDILKQWAAYTYERPLVVTPDGPGVYNDKALGQCFKVLQQ